MFMDLQTSMMLACVVIATILSVITLMNTNVQ